MAAAAVGVGFDAEAGANEGAAGAGVEAAAPENTLGCAADCDWAPAEKSCTGKVGIVEDDALAEAGAAAEAPPKPEAFPDENIEGACAGCAAVVESAAAVYALDGLPEPEACRAD